MPRGRVVAHPATPVWVDRINSKPELGCVAPTIRVGDRVMHIYGCQEFNPWRVCVAPVDYSYPPDSAYAPTCQHAHEWIPAAQFWRDAVVTPQNS